MTGGELAVAWLRRILYYIKEYNQERARPFQWIYKGALLARSFPRTPVTRKMGSPDGYQGAASRRREQQLYGQGHRQGRELQGLPHLQQPYGYH